MVAVASHQPGAEINVSYFELPAPVILIWGDESRQNVRTFTRSNVLSRAVGRLARKAEPIRMIVSGGHRLSDESLDALNLFLKAGRGFRYFGRVITRWDWQELQEFLGLRWTTLLR